MRQLNSFLLAIVFGGCVLGSGDDELDQAGACALAEDWVAGQDVTLNNGDRAEDVQPNGCESFRSDTEAGMAYIHVEAEYDAPLEYPGQGENIKSFTMECELQLFDQGWEVNICVAL